MKTRDGIIYRFRPFLFRIVLFNSIFLGCFSFLFASQFNYNLIPIYPSADNIKTYADDKAKVFSKSYSIKFDYPADEIISFYEASMSKRKYRECDNYNDKSGDWSSFGDISRGTRHYINQYFKEWCSADYKQKAILYLRYESEKKEVIKNKLYVTFQLMPNYDEKAINDFLKEIEEKREYEKFMQLLGKYATADGDIDFEKAINENPENTNLRRYKKIVEETKKMQ